MRPLNPGDLFLAQHSGSAYWLEQKRLSKSELHISVVAFLAALALFF